MTRNSLTLAMLSLSILVTLCSQSTSCKPPVFGSLLCEESHFKFTSVSASDLNSLGLKPAKLRSWTSADRKAVDIQLAKLQANYPGLVQLASYVTPISIKRVSSIDTLTGLHATAFGKNYCIVLSDSFFDSPADQYHVLIHELVHLADCDYYIAYSKEWVDLARAIVSEAQPESTKKQAWYFRNVRESLSEYTAFYCEGKSFFLRSVFEKKIASQLLNPSLDHKHWSLLLAVSKLHLLRGENGEALKSLQKASALAANKPLVFHYLACSYVRLGDIVSARLATVEMMNAFRSLNLPSNDDSKINCVRIIIGEVKKKKGKSQVDVFLSYLQEKFPDESAIQKLQ